jgi:predicted SAM-dependent methyltransferase
MKLHVACGKKRIQGYINTDLRPGPAVDQVLDASKPLPAASYEEIYACHVLEHFYVEETPGILANWVNALVPGGVLRVSVPDLRLIVQNCADTHAFGKDLNAPLFGHYKRNAAEPDRHKQAFVKETLTRLMLGAGLTEVREWASTEVPAIRAVRDWSAYTTISLNLLGVKH